MSLPTVPDVKAARLSACQYTERFADAGNPLTPAQALVEAERCLYCHDAPCTTACPTSIDVPSFIHRIADGNVRGAAKAILEANPLGGMCARVCPTEELCEQACVRNTELGKPVEIGRLQRFAVDKTLAAGGAPLFTRGPSTGKHIAVVGAGPAGLACAHVLARLGHDVTIFDAHEKAGGLNEYGLATYKTAGDFAQREVDWLLSIGGITIQTGWKLTTAAQLEELKAKYAAVFLGVGMGAVNALGVPGEALEGVRSAVDFIAELRQTKDLSSLPIGRRVVVIGGGMTAVDAAVQAKLLGAEEVTMAYRRGPEAMSASKVEQEWAQTNGVSLRHWLAPVAIEGVDGHVTGVRFARQVIEGGKVVATQDEVVVPADMVFKAIGQKLEVQPWPDAGIELQAGRIVVSDTGRTTLPGVWAGGDCVAGGRDLTVEAVDHGKRAALSMHAELTATLA